MTLNNLTGKTALITGSTGGIGMETARGLAGGPHRRLLRRPVPP